MASSQSLPPNTFPQNTDLDCDTVFLQIIETESLGEEIESLGEETEGVHVLTAGFTSETEGVTDFTVRFDVTSLKNLQLLPGILPFESSLRTRKSSFPAPNEAVHPAIM